MTSSEFLGGDNAFHYTWEKRKVTSVLCYLRKAFKGRDWSVCLEGKGPASNCIRSLLPPWNASNDTTIFSSVIVNWPIRFVKDDVIYQTKFPYLEVKCPTRSWTQAISVLMMLETTHRATYGLLMGTAKVRVSLKGGMCVWRLTIKYISLSKWLTTYLAMCMANDWVCMSHIASTCLKHSHVNKKTCWTHPVIKRRYNVVPCESLNWETESHCICNHFLCMSHV